MLDRRAHARATLVACLFLAQTAAGMAAERPDAPLDGDGRPRAAVCFAPGTPWTVVEAYGRRFASGPAVSIDLPGGTVPSYQLGSSAWTRTATDPGPLGQGDPLTLTWSVVPDGTSVDGFAGEARASSNLRATLDRIYGSSAVWLPIFERIFARWGELSGITYVHEPSDDGAAMTNSSMPGGQLGVRGDLRISGHRIDGTNGILAYNFYPNAGGDMVIDTADGNFNDTGGDSLILRNVLAHEHGHGLGIAHVCPVNETKLMEPFLSLRFDGPQHDDILAANRLYGDDRERNDTSATATSIGPIAVGQSLSERTRSIDDDADQDFYAVTVGPAQALSVRVQPLGFTYQSGPQTSQCSSGSSFNSLTVHNLGVEVRDRNGTTVLATATAQPAGQPESLANVTLGGAGTYYVRVFGASTNNAQLYDLTVDSTGSALLPTIYESADATLIVDPANAVGSAAAGPYGLTPKGTADLLFYQVDDGTGNPALLRMVRSGSELTLYF
jgi:hypothetical protein